MSGASCGGTHEEMLWSRIKAALSIALASYKRVQPSGAKVIQKADLFMRPSTCQSGNAECQRRMSQHGAVLSSRSNFPSGMCMGELELLPRPYLPTYLARYCYLASTFYYSFRDGFERMSAGKSDVDEDLSQRSQFLLPYTLVPVTLLFEIDCHCDS